MGVARLWQWLQIGQLQLLSAPALPVHQYSLGKQCIPQVRVVGFRQRRVGGSGELVLQAGIADGAAIDRDGGEESRAQAGVGSRIDQWSSGGFIGPIERGSPVVRHRSWRSDERNGIVSGRPVSSCR